MYEERPILSECLKMLHSKNECEQYILRLKYANTRKPLPPTMSEEERKEKRILKEKIKHRQKRRSMLRKYRMSGKGPSIIEYKNFIKIRWYALLNQINALLKQIEYNSLGGITYHRSALKIKCSGRTLDILNRYFKKLENVKFTKVINKGKHGVRLQQDSLFVIFKKPIKVERIYTYNGEYI